MLETCTDGDSDTFTEQSSPIHPELHLQEPTEKAGIYYNNLNLFELHL